MVNSSKCVRCGKPISDVEYIRYGGVCQECYSKELMDAKRSQFEFDSKKYKFIPAYYEWHLVDENGKVLYVLPDGEDEVLNPNGEPLTLEEVEINIEQDLESQMILWRDNDPENKPDHMLIEGDEMPKSAAAIMAKALYDYYVVGIAA